MIFISLIGFWCITFWGTVKELDLGINSCVWWQTDVSAKSWWYRISHSLFAARGAKITQALAAATCNYAACLLGPICPHLFPSPVNSAAEGDNKTESSSFHQWGVEDGVKGLKLASASSGAGCFLSYIATCYWDWEVLLSCGFSTLLLIFPDRTCHGVLEGFGHWWRSAHIRHWDLGCLMLELEVLLTWDVPVSSLCPPWAGRTGPVLGQRGFVQKAVGLWPSVIGGRDVA